MQRRACGRHSSEDIAWADAAESGELISRTVSAGRVFFFFYRQLADLRANWRFIVFLFDELNISDEMGLMRVWDYDGCRG